MGLFKTILDYALPFIGQGIDYRMQRAGAERQQQYNMQLAEYQHGKNLELMKYQMDYNSPASQMQRFKDAGLNPALVYGQGTPGNLESVPRHPDIKPADLQAAYTGNVEKAMQMRLMQSQVDLTDQKVAESGVKQDVMKAQKSLVEANPYLNKDYVRAMVLNLESVANMKRQQSSFLSGHGPLGDDPSRGFVKMQAELDTLLQRFKLGQADQKLKGAVLQSKEFQNALQEIQLKWMKDGDITPQHIYMGIMLLLQKMM